MDFVFNFLRSIFFTEIIGDITLYTIIASVFKYLFVFIVLYYIYLIVRIIFLDIKSSYNIKENESSYLVLDSKKNKSQKIFLSDYNSIGRDYENDIVLEDNLVSRRHAIIVRKSDGYYIEDMSSSNGTSINDIRINDSKKLVDGDLISIGGSKYFFFDGRVKLEQAK